MVELALLALIGMTVAGFLVLLDRKDRRMHKRLDAHREEVAGLCQRIQAPQVAVAQHAAIGVVDPPAVNPHDDEDYWAARDEALQRIAELEREGLT